MKEYNSYLNAYWDHFKIKQHVTFNTLIKSIRPYENFSKQRKSELKDLEPRTFVVTTVDSKGDRLDQNEKVSTYDYVIIGSGMHSKSYTPTINNLLNFKGLISS